MVSRRGVEELVVVLVMLEFRFRSMGVGVDDGENDEQR